MKQNINIGLLYNNYDETWLINVINDFKHMIINIIKSFNITVNEINDITSYECDLILYSQYSVLNFLRKSNLDITQDNVKKFLNQVKGKPKFLVQWNEYNNWPLEHTHKESTFEIFNNIENIYTLSFNDDNDHNLFYPYTINTFNDVYNSMNIQNTKDVINQKTKFCAYVASNLNAQKEMLFNLISNNIKNEQHYGYYWKWDNKQNSNINLKLDECDAKNVLKNYKFILCVENTYSTNNPRYITEKIDRGYICNCVPIYWGCTHITDIYNEKSFINITNLSEQEIIEKIKYYDNDDDAYLNMLNEYPFNNKDINYIHLFNDKLHKFIYKYIL